MVGACTASPLTGHHDEFRAPLAAAGFEPARLFYLGESVLLPAWRGTGIGQRFFDLREDEARRQGFAECVFCAVLRDDDDPRRPPDYTPLDAFWKKRGYDRIDDAVAHFSWTDLGDGHEREKPMAFWHRKLTP
jgi:GNAT superfamily N-acetyltransferase